MNAFGGLCTECIKRERANNSRPRSSGESGESYPVRVSRNDTRFDQSPESRDNTTPSARQNRYEQLRHATPAEAGVEVVDAKSAEEQRQKHIRYAALGRRRRLLQVYNDGRRDRRCRRSSSHRCRRCRSCLDSCAAARAARRTLRNLVVTVFALHFNLLWFVVVQQKSIIARLLPTARSSAAADRPWTVPRRGARPSERPCSI